MKKTIYLCDVCGKETEQPTKQDGNAKVDFALTGKQAGNLMSYVAIVCEECEVKPISELNTKILISAKQETSGVNVSAISFQSLNVDGTIKGVPVKGLAAPIG